MSTGSPTRPPRGPCPRPGSARPPPAAVPVPGRVLCLPPRGDADVPSAYSERYVAAARAAGGLAGLVELSGDHFTLIDPGAPDWAEVIAALPGLPPGRHPALQPGPDLP